METFAETVSVRFKNIFSVNGYRPIRSKLITLRRTWVKNALLTKLAVTDEIIL